MLQTLRSVLLSPEYRRRVSSIAVELRAQRGSEEVLRFLEKVARLQSVDLALIDEAFPPPRDGGRPIPKRSLALRLALEDRPAAEDELAVKGL